MKLSLGFTTQEVPWPTTGTVEVLDVASHRNGSGGEGFYAITFTDSDPETEGRTFLAVVNPARYEDEQRGGYPNFDTFWEQCFVVDPAKPHDRWRGAGTWQDTFKDAVRMHESFIDSLSASIP